VLEIGQAHHQPRRLGGSAEGPIEAAERPIEAIPLDQPCQAEQLMVLIPPDSLSGELPTDGGKGKEVFAFAESEGPLRIAEAYGLECDAAARMVEA
jgi:hypothetical protein